MAAAAAFLKSPAFTIEILSGSITARMAANTCSGVNWPDGLFQLLAKSERPPILIVCRQCARQCRIIRSIHLPDCSQPTRSLSISLGVNPSFSARASSSLKSASTLEMFCGAAIANTINSPSAS